MTNEELQAIKDRADAATPGPWIANPRATDGYVDDFLGAEIKGPPDAQRGQFARLEDAEFIAHAREDVPALVAHAEVLRSLFWQALEGVITILIENPETRETTIAMLGDLEAAAQSAEKAAG